MNIVSSSNIQMQLPVLYCQAIEFLDKLDELYIGQVLVVTRYSNKNKDIINEVWIREGNTAYRKLDESGVSNMNGDESNVMV